MSQAHVLPREKHTAQAVTLVPHPADQLTGSYDRRSPKDLAAVGLLLLRGVTAASGDGDAAATEEFLAEAKKVARYVSLDRPDAWANFSSRPTSPSTSCTVERCVAGVGYLCLRAGCLVLAEAANASETPAQGQTKQ
jgi:hypothetical protein